MLPIIWRSSARTDLAEIILYIANEDPQAARRLKDRLESAVLPLAEHPYLYRPGRVPGTRELVAHPNYVLVYRVVTECIEVVNVLHARQEYP
ncbi:type II toxin-antitoxin system RelE/ParE family toxin [Pseudomonas aeruginosa]|uniref:type II toxin-antitoxin system RelE/ParE family toxin n=1 Tax=Pseudomonas aeruginosa TaxID=287 RepID=UPI000FD1A2A4|nr:type II toxin-antitoxin system RelE/ParE family toxin [Pseudomonas aeruginosa]MDV7896656.1 type II toxin-antitoxin system RelE/ParE family toxin [Pseudomonas aeruginosa]MED5087634.1 type II toxin-antitoxin system RelE/ParE family toxin [Pseudomonas aeruginosa]RUF06130.1 type II toxin-antitoxin system RelE/ParE family toxin [Pseudomonas aeruginosa]HBO2000447.1 type II toxin-antitoxin system RelE/ParE family toxin [Pseudomonas aeruginosa]HCK4685845.1 type II toxin-antitoxin system RelE/ParE f